MESSRTPSSTLPGPLFPVCPTEEEWARMSPAARDEAELRLNEDFLAAYEQLRASLTPEEARFSPEGDTHADIREASKHSLRRYFGHSGRSIYIASDLPVHYPGQVSLSPDLCAVLDVSPHKRESFMVLREGKGLDLALEILVHGRRNKDLVNNVARYAGLGIREYFVLDVGKGTLRGYRLPEPEARVYLPILGNQGLFSSEVLQLELAYLGGELRFHAGNALLLLPEEERAQLGRLLEQSTAQAEEERRRADESEQRAEQAAAQAEQDRALLLEAVVQLGASIVAVLELRGLAVTGEARKRISGCRDLPLLGRWQAHAMTVERAEDLFQDG